MPIQQFVYQQGDLSLTGKKGLPPVVAPGQALKFINNDGDERIYHTVTSCKAPCNGLTGVAYPLAGGPTTFDSGQLGLGGVPTANRIDLGHADEPRQGPTTTSAGCTRSCGARSASSRSGQTA